MENFIIIAIIVVIIAFAGFYIYKAKKSGQKCIGCPHSKTCSSKACNCCSPNADNDEDKNN